MAERRLADEEAALWARVMASVRPLRPSVATAPRVDAAAQAATSVSRDIASSPTPGRRGAAPALLPVAARPVPGVTLDGSWDRQLARGAVIPDATLDLHGHSLQSAYTLLDDGLDRAIARGARVLLLVTGKPPRAESERPHARGAIRAAVADWLAASRHAASIAAVRGAHPRHGGAGALYIVLRRPRGRADP
jgi:DNA-nicking Smr family endonuclease